MRVITKKHLNRRMFLRGMGATIALPLLDSMIPALAAPGEAAKSLLRLGFIYFPHGAVMDKWTPAKEGAGFDLTPVLQPLEAFRDRFVVVSGLAHHQADSLGDGGADHARSSPTFLSAVHPKRTEGEDVRAGTTIDQIAAQKIGQETRFPSLEVATEDMSGLVGACDTGYSCTYMNTISWRTPTMPNPMEQNPRVVFERLFGEGGTPEEQLARLQEDRSVLDTITKQAKSLQTQLPARDRTRMSEYLDNIREIERRIQMASKQAGSNFEVPDAPVGIPDNWNEHAKLMFDLLALSYQADITRIFTFMLARELSQRTYPEIGVPDPHHAVSHHQDNPEKLAKLVKIQNYHVSLLAHFLEKLRSTPDGNGNLLDHSLIVYGSSMSNSNIHNHSPLPVLVAGGAAGRLQGGRHLKYPENTPMANLLVSVLHKAGIPQEQVGDSTGPLAEL